MRTVKINNKEYQLPESWNEVSIGKFQAFSKIDAEDELDKLLQIVSVLGNIPIDTLESITYTELNKLYGLITFITEEVGDKTYFKINIKGKDYGLDYEWKSMKAKTYIDLDSLMQDKNKVIDNLHLIAAILFRPIIDNKKEVILEDYNYKLLEENGRFMQDNMMISQFLPVLFFFSKLNLNLLQHSVDSLVETLQPKKKSLIKRVIHLVKGGVGLMRFIHSLKIILRIVKRG